MRFWAFDGCNLIKRRRSWQRGLQIFLLRIFFIIHIWYDIWTFQSRTSHVIKSKNGWEQEETVSGSSEFIISRPVVSSVFNELSSSYRRSLTSLWVREILERFQVFCTGRQIKASFVRSLSTVYVSLFLRYFFHKRTINTRGPHIYNFIWIWSYKLSLLSQR